MTDQIKALETLVEAMIDGSISDRQADAQADALLRVGTIRLHHDCPWVWNNFPVWRAMEYPAGRVEVVHISEESGDEDRANGIGGAHWASRRFTRSLDDMLAMQDAVMIDYFWSIDPVGSSGQFFVEVWHKKKGRSVGGHISYQPQRSWLICILWNKIAELKEGLENAD